MHLSKLAFPSTNDPWAKPRWRMPVESDQLDELTRSTRAYRIVIDVLPSELLPDRDGTEKAEHTAIGSMAGLPDLEHDPYDSDVFAVATHEEANQAASAVAAVVSAWLSEAKLTSEKLWGIEGGLTP